jgi:hypothetical protein
LRGLSEPAGAADTQFVPRSLNLSVDASAGGLDSAEPVGAALTQLIPRSLNRSTATEVFFEDNLDDRRAKNERIFFINTSVTLFENQIKKVYWFTKKLALQDCV